MKILLARFSRRLACALLTGAVLAVPALAEGSSANTEGGPTEVTSSQAGGVAEVQDRVEARAREYLEALRLNDWQTAYQMHLEAQDGSLSPLAFRRELSRVSPTIEGFKIVDVSISDTGVATVKASVTYRLPQLFKPYTSQLKMEWLLRDGEYFRRAMERPGPKPTLPLP
jgi:hypothetical protein